MNREQTQARDPIGLADRLKQRTANLHREAEQSGIISDLLRARAGREDYHALLRNLLPIYEALEKALGAPSRPLTVASLARPEIFRADALRADLHTLAGPDWCHLPVVEAAVTYVERIREIGRGDGEELVAHAYVRYLGDLNGGQILKRTIGRVLGLEATGLSFYTFPTSDPRDLARAYRAAIDIAGHALADSRAVVEEAALAFRLNIDLSRQLASGSRGSVPRV